MVMKADLRISIRDYRRNKNLKVLLFRPPFPSRGLMVRMNRREVAEGWGASVCYAGAGSIAKIPG
jgi:hypothetical protein